MFVIEDETTAVPVKVWLGDPTQLDEGCLAQAKHLANLPFIQGWVNLMPDTHQGMGMPIGGVIGTTNTVMPNAVGVDIGCGMVFAGTNLPVSVLRETMTGSGSLVQTIIGEILRNVPVGFAHHKHIQHCYTADRARQELEKYESCTQLLGQIEAAYYQVGTLGGGNHFIELQEDQEGMLGIMIHSGSRNVGKQVCDYFHSMARELNRKWYSSVPDDWRLAFLPADTKAGKDYVSWMKLAMDFAHENREKMMLAVKAILEKWVGKLTDHQLVYDSEINCHHNYAALEHHYGRNVWVHRKGAIRARAGELAVVPGAMGSYSYVVEGLGNPESFCSSAHGAGRKYTRKGAMEAFPTEEVMMDLGKSQVVLGKHSKIDVAAESRFAYKDIDQVMENQKDLVKPVKKLFTVGVVKA